MPCFLHELKPKLTTFNGQRRTKMSFETLEARIEHTEKAAARISGKLLELEQHVVAGSLTSVSTSSSVQGSVVLVPDFEAFRIMLTEQLVVLHDQLILDAAEKTTLLADKKKLVTENDKLKYRVNILLESLKEAESKK